MNRDDYAKELNILYQMAVDHQGVALAYEILLANAEILRPSVVTVSSSHFENKEPK